MPAAKKDKEEAAPAVVDHVEEPDNNPDLEVDNAPHGRRVQGIN